MSFADDVVNAMLELIDETDGTKKIEKISLHTADPGTDGSNEVTGGSYAQQSVTWAAASSGTKANSGSLVFQIPADTTITHVGGWTSDGTFRGGGLLVNSQPFETAGTYTMAAGELAVSI